MTKTILTALILLLSTLSFAQNYILIRKKGTTTSYKIYEGETLRFKHKDSTHMQREELQSINDSTLLTEFTEVRIADIKIIHYQNNKRFIYPLLRSLGRSLIFAGPMFFGYNALNAFIFNVAGTWGRAALTGGIITASGLFLQGILKLTTERRIRITDKWEIVPYNFNNLLRQ